MDEGRGQAGGRGVGGQARAVESLEKNLTVEPKAKDADAIRSIIAEMRAQAPRKSQ